MKPFKRRIVKTSFTVVPNPIVEDDRLSLADKGVALMLWSTPDGWIFHPEDFARKTSNGIEAVKASLRRLEKAGYITRSKFRDEKGVIVGADYILHETPKTEDGLKAEKQEQGSANEGNSHGGKTDRINNTHLIPIHTLNQNTPNRGQAPLFADANPDSGSDAKVIDTTEGFDAFWAAYPKCERKVGKAKCLDIWRRNHLHKVASAVMTALAIDAKSSDWTKENGRFIPMPATWLNRKRHEDVRQPQEGPSSHQCDTFAVLTYDDVSAGRMHEWNKWNEKREGTPPSWSIKSVEWVRANRSEIIHAERIAK